MKKILIPTDFSPCTITLVEKLKEQYDEEFQVLFTHLFYLPDGIQDLLFGTYRLKEYQFVSREFQLSYARCMQPGSSDPTQVKVPVRFFYGHTLAFFKNFLAANTIDLIAYSENEPVKKLNSSSMVPLFPILKKCGVPLLNVDTISTTNNHSV
ncbi:MAG: hypothetical protein K0S33_3934 [Bacteroidetes bacterium]|jgi:hypothetical protein|nr:hypothetical protein [Bacteroidota bacterium]